MAAAHALDSPPVFACPVQVTEQSAWLGFLRGLHNEGAHDDDDDDDRDYSYAADASRMGEWEEEWDEARHFFGRLTSAQCLLRPLSHTRAITSGAGAERFHPARRTLRSTL